jgi:hypothetical protein
VRQYADDCVLPLVSAKVEGAQESSLRFWCGNMPAGDQLIDQYDRVQYMHTYIHISIIYQF